MFIINKKIRVNVLCSRQNSAHIRRNIWVVLIITAVEIIATGITAVIITATITAITLAIIIVEIIADVETLSQIVAAAIVVELL